MNVQMTTRRRYTKRQKATAVIAAEMSSVAAAAEAQGIPERTVAYWVDAPEFAELRAKTREDLAAGFHLLAHLAQERIKELLPTMDGRDVTVLLGVATDKAQLLAGQPTARTENRELVDQMDDHETAALRKILDDAAKEVV